MNNTIYILVNGILTNPEDVDSWTDRAEEWIDTNTEFKATKMEYRSGAFTRRIFQSARVKNLQKICKAYLGDKIILVGHSNGCDIIQRMINKGIPKVHELHLIAAASEHDFKKNGFNRALKNGHVERIIVYMSTIDNVLKKAKLSSRLFGWMGLGYGYLGLTGPLNVDPSVEAKVFVHNEPMSHSQWFSKKSFERTMKTITGKT